MHVNVLKGTAGRMSDHYLVKASLKIYGIFEKEEKLSGKREWREQVTLEKKRVKKYQQRLSVEWQKVKANETRGVD